MRWEAPAPCPSISPPEVPVAPLSGVRRRMQLTEAPITSGRSRSAPEGARAGDSLCFCADAGDGAAALCGHKSIPVPLRRSEVEARPLGGLSPSGEPEAA